MEPTPQPSYEVYSPPDSPEPGPPAWPTVPPPSTAPPPPPVPSPSTAAPAGFWPAPQRTSGRALRGVGIALMIFGLLPILATLLTAIVATAEGALHLVYLSYLRIIGFFGSFALVGFILHRAGVRKRDRHLPTPPTYR